MFGLENESVRNQILSATQPRELGMCVWGGRVAVKKNGKLQVFSERGPRVL